MACCKHSDGYKDIGMQDSGFKINNSMIHVKKEQIDRRCWMLNDNLVELP